MIRSTKLLVLALAVLGAGAVQGGEIHSYLQSVLSNTAPDKPVSTLVFLADQVDLVALTAELDARNATRRERHERVVRALKAKAAGTQADLLAELQRRRTEGSVESFEAFWISNAFRVDAKKGAIEALASRNDVRRIYFNYKVQLAQSGGEELATCEPSSGAPGLEAINAPLVWQELGIMGEGILVGSIDTGVKLGHEVLAANWKGNEPGYLTEWAWKDLIGGAPLPTDHGWLAGHGTGVMGVICGNPPNAKLGVAPGSKWITAAAIAPEGVLSKVKLAFQWMADPDGDESTVWDVPHVCCNSWGLQASQGAPPCDPVLWSYLDRCEAAGTVIVFCAHNDDCRGLRNPADRAVDEYRTLAVAGVDAHESGTGWPVWIASARGPTFCTGAGESEAIKPDISAPAYRICVATKSTERPYALSSGTSFAAPHVAGVVALMREACPDLPVTQVKEILYVTARDLGLHEKDNDSGWGMVDAYAAVQMAIAFCDAGTPTPPLVGNTAAEGKLNRPTAARLRAFDDGLPNPPGAMNLVIVSLPEHGLLVDPLGGAIENVPHVLVNHGIEVAYYPFGYFSGVDAFHWKADDGGSPPTGGYSAEAQTTLTIAPHEVVLSWTFDEPNEPAGWTGEGQWAYGQPEGQGGGVMLGGPDPTQGHTGDYVYGYNLSGNYGYLPGEENLTSPPITCADLSDARLGYWRWLGVDDNEFEGESDYAFIRVRRSVNEQWQAWQDIWVNPAGGNADCRWTYHELDLSPVLTGSTTFQLRWTMGPTGPLQHACGWNIDDVMLWAVQQYEGVFASPRAHVVAHGNPTSGHRGSLFYSDDERMWIGSEPNGADPEVVLDVDTVSGELDPSELHFTLEGHVAEFGTYTQVVSLHNWNTGLFETIDSRPAATGSDAVLTLPITTNPERFVDPATGAMKARMSWKAGPGAPVPYTVAIDQVLWNVCEQ